MPDPRSAIARAADKLCRMVALSETFAGNLSYPDALARVHRRDASADTDRPLAVVSPGDKHDFELIAGGSQNHLRASGSLFLYLARDTQRHVLHDRVLAEEDAANWFGSVIEQVAELSGCDDPESEDSHLSIVRISRTLFDECDEDHWNSLGRFYFAAYLIEWGDG